MDFYSFVNSKAIREHLRSINYQFNSLEVAWLIYSCERLSFQEKKEYWLELMDVLPDTDMPPTRVHEEWKTVYELLPKYIDLIESFVAELFKEDIDNEYVYMYSYLYMGDSSWSEEFDTVFRSIDDCINVIKKEVLELDEIYVKDEKSTGVIEYVIRKQSLINTDKKIEVSFAGGGKVKDVRYNSISDGDTIDLENALYYQWFSFPTPFKKGDIVWEPKPDNMIRWDSDGPFVLEGLSTWNPIDHTVKYGDSSDMRAYGYFLNPNGTIYQDGMGNYMDLEYYDEPFEGDGRMLTAISKYLKDEINLEFLLCVYRRTLLDAAERDVMLTNWFPQEWVEGVGIPFRR